MNKQVGSGNLKGTNFQDISMPLTTIAKLLQEARHVAIFTGAGVSAESGIPTFKRCVDRSLVSIRSWPTSNCRGIPSGSEPVLGLV